jgi:hypothetical protein
MVLNIIIPSHKIHGINVNLDFQPLFDRFRPDGINNQNLRPDIIALQEELPTISADPGVSARVNDVFTIIGSLKGQF